MVCQFTFNLYFHCCYRCCYMYIADCNKDLIFFSAFLDLKSIRDDEATTQRSSFSLMLWQMLWLFHGKHELKLPTLAKHPGKTMTFYESIRAFPKTPVFDHSNYRFFERIPAVPGTSNNRGLTVCILIKTNSGDWFRAFWFLLWVTMDVFIYFYCLLFFIEWHIFIEAYILLIIVQ